MIEKIDRLLDICHTYSIEEIKQNYLCFDSLQYEFEKLYEDSTRLSPDLIISHPELPIDKLRSIRNRVAHDYESVVIQILIDTVNENLPEFKQALQSIIK